MKSAILSLFVATLFFNISLSNAAPSTNLLNLGSQFKKYSSETAAKPNERSLTMVYGGADISPRPTLRLHTSAF